MKIYELLRGWLGKMAFIFLVFIASVVVILVSVFAPAVATTAKVDLDEQGIRIRPNVNAGTLVTTKFGMSGFFPANFPQHSVSDLKDFWREINFYTDSYGVHVDWQDTIILDITAENYDGELILVLGFQNPQQWQSSVGAFIASTSEILTKYPGIKYLGIGNEVNLLADDFPGQFENFAAAYRQIYTELKAEFGQVQIFPTFQYEDLIGEGYLMHGSSSNRQAWELLNEFENFMDVFAITTYPYFDHPQVVDLPNDYYAQATEFTDKQILITETGWMSRWEFGGDLSYLTEQGFTGSELEQDEYLAWLLGRVVESPGLFVAVNWLGLHDISAWQEGDAPKTLPLFDSLGLKFNDGSEKAAWNRWKGIFR